jgi:hypothetical protein
MHPLQSCVSFICSPATELSLLLQACYGHTEGTAGITGVLLATAAFQRASAPGVTNLREARANILRSSIAAGLTHRQCTSIGATG